MKMYILLKDDVPDKLAPVIAAHASLACYKKFEKDARMIRWINGVFKKVVCSVSETEFNQLKNEPDHLILTESSLNNKEACLVFCPREEYPKKFKFFKMWSPQQKSVN